MWKFYYKYACVSWQASNQGDFCELQEQNPDDSTTC